MNNKTCRMTKTKLDTTRVLEHSNWTFVARRNADMEKIVLMSLNAH